MSSNESAGVSILAVVVVGAQLIAPALWQIYGKAHPQTSGGGRGAIDCARIVANLR